MSKTTKVNLHGEATLDTLDAALSTVLFTGTALLDGCTKAQAEQLTEERLAHDQVIARIAKGTYTDIRGAQIKFMRSFTGLLKGVRLNGRGTGFVVINSLRQDTEGDPMATYTLPLHALRSIHRS